MLVSDHSPLLNNDFLNPGEHADFPQPPLNRLPELDLVEGVGPFEGQNPPQGPLKHLKLIPENAERHFGPPQINCSPLVIFFLGYS